MTIGVEGRYIPQQEAAVGLLVVVAPNWNSALELACIIVSSKIEQCHFICCGLRENNQKIIMF